MTSKDVVVPEFDAGAAEALSLELFGVRAEALALPSYVDQNFRLTTAEGERYVLKIAHAGEDAPVLDAQNNLMNQLASAGFDVPRVLPSSDGLLRSVIPAPDGRVHCVRLMTYLAGIPLAAEPTHPRVLLEDLGRFLGRLDRALEDFDAPALRREYHWNLASALMVRPHTDALASTQRSRANSAFAQFGDRVLPLLRELPHGVIHNDANDYNILVDEGRVVGLIDFGDAVFAPRVCELAICLAYAMLGKEEPVRAVQPVLRGYQRELALEENELELLFDLIYTRLIVSITMSAHAKLTRPGNEYLNVTEARAWRVLDRLDALGRDGAVREFLATSREVKR